MASKGFRRNRKGGRKGSKTPKMSFSKRVLSVFNKQRELKCGTPLTHAIIDVREGITLANRATNQLAILGPIAQGDDEFQRQGNQITLKKIVMRGYYRIQYPVGSAINCRLLIRNFIMRQRSVEDAQLLLNGTLNMNYNNLLEPANSYLGAVADYNTPINRDAFVVKKQFKRILTSEYDSVALDAVGTQESYVFFNYTMTFGKGKELRYRTGGATYPEDFPYFLAHSASYLGSNIAPSVGIIGFNLTSTPYFFDD